MEHRDKKIERRIQMRRILWSSVIYLLLVTGALSQSSVVVTNPPPAVHATMSLAPDVLTWIVEGKVTPAYRGRGASVTLVCAPVACEAGGGSCSVFVVGSSNGLNDQPVNSCGNFSFDVFPAVDSSGNPAPFIAPPDYECHFIVHVSNGIAPACRSGKPSVPSDPPVVLNSTAPCSGGLCPGAP